MLGWLQIKLGWKPNPMLLELLPPKAERTIETLGITREDAARILAVFFRIDKDASNEVSLVEFLSYFKFEPTKFAVRCFSIMDEDRSGEIDFREFLVSIWNYCTYTKHGLMLFAFDLYDLDNSGEIDQDEMERIVVEIYGTGDRTSYMAKQLILEINKLSGMDMISINKEQFCKFVHYHPSMLLPAFTMQHELQKRVLGRRYWMKAAKARAAREGISEELGWQEFQKQITKKAFTKLVKGDKRKSKKKKGSETAAVLGSVSQRRSVLQATGEVKIHDPHAASAVCKKKSKKKRKKVVADS